jgi:hypothetical protein
MADGNTDDDAAAEMLRWAREQTERCRAAKPELTLADLEGLLANPDIRVPVRAGEQSPPRYSIAGDVPRVAWILVVQHFIDRFEVDFGPRRYSGPAGTGK